MERRNFLKVCGLTCLGSLSLSMILSSCSNVKYIQAKAENNIIKIPLLDFEEKDEKTNSVNYSKAIIVKPDISDFPIVIFRNSETDYKALLLRCSHQGSELSVYGDMLTCSAHGSEFDKSGNVLIGPAVEPLHSFPVNIQNNFLFLTMV